ncbi:methyl-accepting chemotaxis protein [Lachnospiraceae bacterium]|nr:methyl-accepting chemotaxis protein [Lachnospiraceae bacterium]
MLLLAAGKLMKGEPNMAVEEVKGRSAPKNDEFKIKKSVSATLLTILLPVMVIGIVVIISVLITQAKSSIIDLVDQDLQAETTANARDIGSQMEMVTEHFDAYANTLETVMFKDHDAMLEYLLPTPNYDAIKNIGLFIGFSDNTYFFANGTTHHNDGWVATEREWYKRGIQTKEWVSTDPYIDSTTGDLCITISRRVDFKNGEVGVIATDIFLADVQAKANSLIPLKTGSSFIVDGSGYIMSYSEPDKVGTMLSDTNPELNAVWKSNSGTVERIKYSNGHKYYVAFASVPGTTWTLISSVGEASVLEKLRQFQFIAFTLLIVVTVTIAVIILVAIKRIISVPIQSLARKISLIAGGDFTVDFSGAKGDEIGLIRNELSGYVTKMRETISNIQSTAEKLGEEAESSKAAASSMSEQTREQSHSMGQIHEVMEGMTNAVSDLANNATELAGAVSDLTQKGSAANSTMLQLVDQASAGKKDMGAVRNNMSHITDSMAEMNSVVVTVGESAEKINGIVEMIDSIAMQTNLLSLNASIEAARAGEAGKGFAVVAGEIAKLATDSSESAGKIAEIIEDITGQIGTLSEKSQSNVDAISNSTKAVTTAGETFEKIYDELNVTSDTVKEMISMMGDVDGIASSVAAISEQQSASSEEISATVENLAESAQRVADESEGVSKGADVVTDSAIEIKDELRVFRI